MSSHATQHYFALSAKGNVDGGIDKVRTMVFVSVILFEILLPFALRSFRHSIIHVNLLTNKFLIAAVLWEILLLILNVPMLRTVFGLVPLSITEWCIVTGLGVSGFAAVELATASLRRFHAVDVEKVVAQM